MAIILDGTTGLNTPGVTDTGNLSVTGTSTLTGGITGSAVNLTSNVTGTLPIANGGTGTTSTTFVNAATNVTGTLPIANGGTNSTATATAGGAGYGTGTAHAYTAAGTSGQFLQSNGASAPTWATLSSGTVPFTASGSIASAGKVVALNANGTVSSVTGQTEALATGAVYSTNVGENKAVGYNTTGSVILMAYRSQNTARLFVVAGTLSGTTITWGTPVNVDPDNDPSSMSVQYAPNSGVFFVLFSMGTALNYVSVTVTGTTSSVSGISLYKTVSSRSDWQKLFFNPNTNSMIVAHQEYAGAGYYQYVTACTVSGGSLSRGTEQTMGTGYGECYISSVGSNRFIICYQNTSSQSVYALFVNASGNTSSIAQVGVTAIVSASSACAVYDTYNNIIAIFSAYGQRVVYRPVTAISDTAITLGTEVRITSFDATDSTLNLPQARSGSRGVEYDALNRKITMMYRAAGGTYPAGCYIFSGAFSNSVFTARSKVQVTSLANDFAYTCSDLIYTGDTNNKMLLVFTDSGAGYPAPLIKLFTNEASTNVNTLGIAQSSATNGQTVQVKLPYQVDTNQTGLTAGSTYYVAGDGTVTTSAGTTNFLLGKATSATSLLITKWSQ